jgi:uncharacterized protein YbjT (DUF2867 family)
VTSETTTGDGPLCLVTGATGYIGGRLVPELLAHGYRVRCAARSPERLRDQPWSARVEVVRADLTDADAVRRALRDVEVAYYLVHALGSGRDFGETDRRTARVFAAAAKEAGVGRVVYLGGLAPSGESGQVSEHLRSRGEVGGILLASGVPTAALRAAVVIGSGSVSFEMMRYLTERLPLMIAPRWVHSRIQPIAVRDALRYLVGCAALPSDVNRSFDIGGPDIVTYEQMMRRYAAVAGLRHRRIRPVGVLSPRLSSLWVGLVTPVPGGIARPLVDSLRHEVVCHEHDIAAYVPDPPEGLIGFDRAVRLALKRIGSGDVATRWSSASVPGAPSDPLPTDPDWAGGSLYADVRESPVTASREALWQVIESIGGENGWYSWPLAWTARPVRPPGGRGGAAARTSRPVPAAHRRLAGLLARGGARAGASAAAARRDAAALAWLDLSVDERDGRTWFRQRALFHPRGLPGQFYWWGVRPFHGVIFGRMQRNIRRAAEARQDCAPRSSAPTLGG